MNFFNAKMPQFTLWHLVNLQVQNSNQLLEDLRLLCDLLAAELTHMTLENIGLFDQFILHVLLCTFPNQTSNIV